jgi:DNA topoisomerase-2
VAKFGCKVDVSDALVERLSEHRPAAARDARDPQPEQAVKKTDGAKRNVVRVPERRQLGGYQGLCQVHLVLTEGDSAASSALAGLSVVGVTPSACSLRGKLLNVRDATVGKVADNEEITNVKKILGLESGKTYAGLDDLR